MVKTLGLTHLAIAVSDLDRSLRFYQELLGARVLYRGPKGMDIGTPGCNDVITLQLAEAGTTGETGNIGHFGFRLTRPQDVETAAQDVEHGGGSVHGKGEFAPGVPGDVVWARDPDGYVIELWYEEETGERD